MLNNIALYMMSLLYVTAGVFHFLKPKFYLKIIPPWLPNPIVINYLSGACEIIFAILLIPVATRHAGAWLIIALLIAVFPANIQMTINFWRDNNPNLWITIARLPIQFLLIWWTYQYTR